jgi:zinc transport system ATP-binding protein
MPMNTIIIDHVTFGYTEEVMIYDLSFTIHSGELVAFVGENGSGKSTLLKLILGEFKPDKGTATVLDKDIQNMKSFREIGYVPQLLARCS